MLTCGLAAEAGCWQSPAQVPNRPNCWNNTSTGAVWAAAGMAVAAASTKTAATRMTSPLHRLRENLRCNNSSAPRDGNRRARKAPRPVHGVTFLLREAQLRRRHHIAERLDVGIDARLERVAGRPARLDRHFLQARLHARVGERAA